MLRVPAKHRRTLITELERFIPVIHNLAAKGKAPSEDDARIVLNDILSYVLGFDKYNELRTELREKNGRFDYVVKLSEGPNAKKQDKFDFVIEARAVHVDLSQHHVNQTLAYCLSKGLDYFVLTNVMKWRLYKVKRTKNDPHANLIHEVDFVGGNDPETFAEDFYAFSKACCLSSDWERVAIQVKATDVGDVAATLISDKVVKRVCKTLEEIHRTKISTDMVKDIIENKIIKTETMCINKSFLKKIERNNANRGKGRQKVGVPEAAVGESCQEKSQIDPDRGGLMVAALPANRS